MKTCEITFFEIISLDVPWVWTPGPRFYIEEWLKDKLLQAGFDLSEEVIRMDSIARQSVIFYQRENNAPIRFGFRTNRKR